MRQNIIICMDDKFNLNFNCIKKKLGRIPKVFIMTYSTVNW